MVKMEFVIDLELSPDQKLAMEDAGKDIKNLKEQVFFVHAIDASKRDVINRALPLF
jgi:hypothetical protein